jgi:hypothetical protein
MEKTAKTIVNEMINSNMLDFGMELPTVRGIIEQMKNEEISLGIEVDYDVNELVSAYNKINICSL